MLLLVGTNSKKNQFVKITKCKIRVNLIIHKFKFKQKLGYLLSAIVSGFKLFLNFFFRAFTMLSAVLISVESVLKNSNNLFYDHSYSPFTHLSFINVKIEKLSLNAQFKLLFF